MTQAASPSVLRRLARAPGSFRPPLLTPARALRLACSRAAERSVNLRLSVLGIGDETQRLDDVLGTLDASLMILSLADDAGFSGLAALDTEARAAVIESQTLGAVLPRPSDPRPVTAADVALSEPFVTRLLAELDSATESTVLDGWARGHRVESRFASAREAGLNLADGQYRVVRFTLDFGAGGRQGLLILALPAGGEVVAEPPEPAPDPARFGQALQASVLAAPATLNAILHRMRLPFQMVEGFAPGQVVPLQGCTVSSVRVEGPDGRLVARARLGQMSGQRALRIEQPLPSRVLSDLVPPFAGGGGAVPPGRGLPLAAGIGAGGFPGGGFPDEGLEDAGLSAGALAEGALAAGGFPAAGLAQGGFPQADFPDLPDAESDLGDDGFPTFGSAVEIDLNQPG